VAGSNGFAVIADRDPVSGVITRALGRFRASGIGAMTRISS